MASSKLASAEARQPIKEVARSARALEGQNALRDNRCLPYLLDSGATLAFASDWNVAPLDPLQGLAAAITRLTLDGQDPDGWVTGQKIRLGDSDRRRLSPGSGFWC